MQVIYNFGRDDASNRQALIRLAASVVKILEPAQLLDVAADGLEFVDSRPFGAVWVLDALWRQLELDGTFRRMRRDGALDPEAERVLFALVASRALAGWADPPTEVARWVTEDVFVDGLPATTEDACQKVTEWLCEVSGRLQEEVFHRVADRLDLKADLLFFESAHGGPQPGLGLDGDPPCSGPEDSPSLAPPSGCHEAHQTVIGLAVARTGIPLRVWRWPGCTDDAAMIRQAKEDMKGWTLSRVIRTADRGCPIAADRHPPRTDDDHHYIVGAKLRSGSAVADAALSRQGRYHHVAANLRVKEVHIAADERFVICCDARTAQRDAEVRTRLVEELSALIDDTDRLSLAERTDLHMEISANPRMRRYLRLTPGRLLRIDVKAVKAEENLDGKYLVRTTDLELPAEEVALGYMGLLECERGWRDLLAGLRRLQSRGEPGECGHLLLTWLSLLLVRIAESRTGLPWSALRREFDRIKLGTFAACAGVLRQRTEITEEQYELLAALGLAPPPRIVQISPPDG
ncbi:transposase [Nonomuraea zeae]|uniref:Transposase n=1 Tax=Nonomuraea zeae TaxID=1642303 RepID=A0A5S4G3U6_9ACTN|nr:transposase [Nonomuraea zeae]TMR27512.1 transposase [Nonomuraea zeae]